MTYAILSILLLASSAAPEPKRLVIVASIQGDNPAARVEDLERLAIEESELRPGITRIEAAIDRTRALRCGSDPTCLAGVLGTTSADLALLIAADYRLDPPLVGLSLIDLAGRTAISLTSVDLDKSSLRAALSTAISSSFDAGHFASAAVVEASVLPLGSEVAVTPLPLRAEGRTLWLAPGRYEINVSQEGFVSTRTEVQVEAGTRRAVGVRLAEEETVLRPVLWTALIVGVAGAGALIAALLIGGGSTCLCVDHGTGCQDGCASP